MSAETLLCDPVLRHGWDVYLIAMCGYIFAIGVVSTDGCRT